MSCALATGTLLHAFKGRATVATATDRRAILCQSTGQRWRWVSYPSWLQVEWKMHCRLQRSCVQCASQFLVLGAWLAAAVAPTDEIHRWRWWMYLLWRIYCYARIFTSTRTILINSLSTFKWLWYTPLATYIHTNALYYYESTTPFFS